MSKNTRRRKPSYLLFSEFIGRKNDGTVDAEGLLRKECYQSWLKTREKPPALPEESYRKILTSHCRGAPGMKPFSPEVEPHVLTLIRKQRIWPCFENTKVRIGIRGCNLVGFWESVRFEAENPNKKSSNKRGNHREQIGPGKIEPLDTSFPQITLGVLPRHPSTYSMNPNAQIDIPYYLSRMYTENERIYKNTSKQQDGSRLKLTNDVADFLDTFSLFVQREIEGCGVEQSEIKDILTRFKVALEKDGFVKETCGVIFGFLPEAYLHMFILSLFKATHFKPMEVTNTQNWQKVLTDPSLKHFMTRDFYIPAKTARVFNAGKIVGICYADFVTYSIVDVDERCKQIYRGDITGYHSIQTRVHKLQSVQFMQDQLAELFTTGVAWTRSIEYRCDKTVMVLLNRYTLPNMNSLSCKVEHQDITELYAHLL